MSLALPGGSFTTGKLSHELGKSKVCKYIVVVEFPMHFCMHHSYLEFRTDLWTGKAFLFHLLDEEWEALRGFVSCPRTLHWQLADLRPEHTTSNSETAHRLFQCFFLSWLFWVFTAVQVFLWLWCVGFSSQRLLLLRSRGSREQAQ